MTSISEIRPSLLVSRWTRAAPTWAPALFFLQFAGYFVYQYLAAAGVIPLVVRGWFPMIAALSVALLGLPLLWAQPWIGRQRAVHIAFAVLCAIVAAYAVIHHLWGHEWQRSRELLFTSGAILTSWVGLYVLGYWLRNDALLKPTVIASVVIMSLLTLASIDPRTGLFIATARFGATTEGVASYQGFALVFVPAALLALALTREWAQIVILGVLATVFVALASRSDLFGFLFVVCVWATLNFWRGQYYRPLAGALAVFAGWAALIGAIFLINSVTLSESEQQAVSQSLSAYTEDGTDISRHLVITDLSQSRSMKDRAKAFKMGWDDIQSSPLLGVYGGQTKNGGPVGMWMHNVLSVWHQFGLAAFVVYLALCLMTPGFALFQVFLRRADDPLWHAVLYLGMFCLLLVVFSKAVFWSLPALAWGLLAGRLAELGEVEGDVAAVQAQLPLSRLPF